MKKILTVIIVLAMSLAVMGCGDKSEPKTPPNETAETLKPASPKYECECAIGDEGLRDAYIYTFGTGAVDVDNGDYLILINGTFYPVSIKNADDLRQAASELGITLSDNAQSGIIPAMPTDKILFLNGEVTEPGIAYNPVAWIDDLDANYDTMTEAELTEWLKAQLQACLDLLKAADFDTFWQGNFKEWSDELINRHLDLLQQRVDETEFLGSVGRYALFRGPYMTLVDTANENAVYFYKYGHLFGWLGDPDFTDAETFISMYLAD